MSAAESNTPVEIGSTVNMVTWDATVPHNQHLGPCTVVAAWPARCESGWMVLLRTMDARMIRLDSGWID